MSSYILKIIGVITMLIDHTGDAIVGHFSYLNLIGRIAFPIFAYQAVQGYMHTKELKKHLYKLFIFALISQAPFTLFLSLFTTSFYLNIFFTLLLGLLALFFYDKSKNKVLGFFIVILFSILGQIIKVDYQAFGILIIFVFYFFEHEFEIIFKNSKMLKYRKLLMIFSATLLCFGRYIPDIIKFPNQIGHYLLCGLFTSFALIFISFYNKKEGPKAKYFFYLFYPLHLLALYFMEMGTVRISIFKLKPDFPIGLTVPCLFPSQQ